MLYYVPIGVNCRCAAILKRKEVRFYVCENRNAIINEINSLYSNCDIMHIYDLHH